MFDLLSSSYIMASEHIKEKKGWRLCSPAMPLKNPGSAFFMLTEDNTSGEMLQTTLFKIFVFLDKIGTPFLDTVAFGKPQRNPDVRLVWLIYAVLFLPLSSVSWIKSCKWGQHSGTVALTARQIIIFPFVNLFFLFFFHGCFLFAWVFLAHPSQSSEVMTFSMQSHLAVFILWFSIQWILRLAQSNESRTEWILGLEDR